jgi:hypothetical protein
MRKLLLATAAVALAAPALAQNAPSDQTPSRDPSPQIQNDINRDAQQSGGGAARTGQGGQQMPNTTGSGAATRGQGGVVMPSNPDQAAPDLPPRRTPDSSTGMPGDTRN